MIERAAVPASTLRVWDLPTRVFHWLLVAAVTIAFLSSEEDSAFADWHQAAGWVAAVLIVFRIVWGFVGGEHARFADFVRPSRIGGHIGRLFRGSPEADVGHNPLGALAVMGLLALITAVVATGILMLRGGGEDDLHEAVAYGLLALIGVHVAAVLVMSMATGENLARAMIDGRKPAVRHPGARDAKSAPGFALPLAALAVAVAVFGATRIDPQAFIPHPNAESGEHVSGGATQEDDEPEERDGHVPYA